MAREQIGIMPVYMTGNEDLAITEKAIRTFRETTDAHLIVVDDRSPARELVEPLTQFVLSRGGSIYCQPENRGFAAAVNVGLRTAQEHGFDAVLVNADIEFIASDWLQALLESDGDVVGAKLLYPNGLVQHAGVFFSLINRNFDHIYRMAPNNLAITNRERICPVTGALQLIRNEVIESVGLFDEGFKFGYEDIDYCHRVFQSGRKCVYQPKSVALHHEGLFRKKDRENIEPRYDESWAYLHRKHAGHDFSQYVPTLIWDEEI